MKTLTLTQPWATLVAIGAKRIESRSWPTKYRGPLAIHAAKGFPRQARHFSSRAPAAELLHRAGYGWYGEDTVVELPLGTVVATCQLVCVVQIGPHGPPASFVPDQPREHETFRMTDQEFAFGNYSPGRFAWLLADVEPLSEPVPATGRLGLWDWWPSAPHRPWT